MSRIPSASGFCSSKMFKVERVELQRSNGGAACSGQFAAAIVPFFGLFLPMMKGVHPSRPLRRLRRLSPISSVPLYEGGRVS